MQHSSQHCSKDCQAQSILPRLRSALFKDHSVNSTMDNGCVSLDLLCTLSTPGQMFDQGVRHLLLKCDQCYHIFVKCNQQWLRRDFHYKCVVFVKYLLGLHVISANIFTHSWTCKESVSTMHICLTEGDVCPITSTVCVLNHQSVTLALRQVTSTLDGVKETKI